VAPSEHSVDKVDVKIESLADSQSVTLTYPIDEIDSNAFTTELSCVLNEIYISCENVFEENSKMLAEMESELDDESFIGVDGLDSISQSEETKGDETPEQNPGKTSNGVTFFSDINGGAGNALDVDIK
jgi:hypothetical protein